jgi:hypothetical protein
MSLTLDLTHLLKRQRANGVGNKSKDLSIYSQAEVFVDDTYRMIQEIFSQE